jgi:hypothetical protein
LASGRLVPPRGRVIPVVAFGIAFGIAFVSTPVVERSRMNNDFGSIAAYHMELALTCSIHTKTGDEALCNI